jgi:hypothetical protein
MENHENESESASWLPVFKSLTYLFNREEAAVLVTHHGDQDLSNGPESTSRGSSPLPVTCPPSIDEKKLMRKIDFRLLPILFIIYVAAFLDR